ncbi:MAG: BamA/TamA family outer membrane protein [Alphaproteobacteria bacterium]|nr:BamA/TamA family outer membrane protein [Alphaproteobacteria bacterium]
MRKLESEKNRLRLFFCFCLLSVGSLLLSGCLPGVLQPKAKYMLAEIEDNKDLSDEVRDFLEERAATIDIADKEGDVETQQQAYHERQLRDGILGELTSEGYYDADVSYTDGTSQWTGTYTVNSGQRYKVREISVIPAEYANFAGKDIKGQPLSASVVLAVQEKLYSDISKGKCFFDLVVDHEVTLDLKTKEADILFIVKAEPQAKMGMVTFEGTDTVKKSYLQKLVVWKEGDCFQRKKIERLRAKLLESGLFSSAELVMPEQPLKDGSVPVTLRVKERALRSVRAGGSYYTGEGLGLTLGWKHSNLFGAAEVFDTGVNLSQKLQIIESRLTKPFFLRRDQSLSFNTNIVHETTSSYTKIGMNTGASINRAFSKSLSASTGVSLSMSRVEDETVSETNTFYLMSLPQSFKYNRRNSVLDATEGFLIEGKLEPFVDLGGESPAFWKTEVSAYTYHALGKKTTAAFRVKTGSVFGTDIAEIPATKRFYAGGGGSVRGFGYQEVGPLKNGEPEGGSSVVEMSAELRFKMTDTIGAAAFVDVGSVSNTSLANFDSPFIGGGGGLRYYTGAGPLRLDVAVPLNKRDTASSRYQIYISIGQAF